MVDGQHSENLERTTLVLNTDGDVIGSVFFPFKKLNYKNHI